MNRDMIATNLRCQMRNVAPHKEEFAVMFNTNIDQTYLLPEEFHGWYLIDKICNRNIFSKLYPFRVEGIYSKNKPEKEDGIQ